MKTGINFYPDQILLLVKVITQVNILTQRDNSGILNILLFVTSDLQFLKYC